MDHARTELRTGWTIPRPEEILAVTDFRKGTKVEWTWGAHTAEGKIAEKFEKDVTRTIKGEKIKRKASAEEPAYLIEQDDGSRVLKSASELRKSG
jgi:hypothetical protein